MLEILEPERAVKRESFGSTKKKTTTEKQIRTI